MTNMQIVSPGIAESMSSSSFIRKMFEKGIELKKQFGEDAVCDFSLGNPDVPPPAKTRDVLLRIADDVVKPLGLGYCQNAGIPFVREAIAKYLSKQQDVQLSGTDIVMTVGAAGAMVSFFRAVVEPGDEIITPAPYFVEYGAYCGHFGGVLRPVPSIPPAFNPDIDAIESTITSKTRAIIVNSPNNPTGCIYPPSVISTLAKIVDRINDERANIPGSRPLFLLSDEPYRAFAFDGASVPSVLALSKWACVLGSFSKTLSLAGERIGYFAANPEMPGHDLLISAVTLTNRTLGSVNAPVLGQRLAAELIDESVDLAIYDRRRRLMANVLSDAGVEFELPKGAFYFFAKSPVADESVFVDELLKERILVVPGRGFGFSGYVRISCCVDERIIVRSAEGFKRVMLKFRESE